MLRVAALLSLLVIPSVMGTAAEPRGETSRPRSPSIPLPVSLERIPQDTRDAIVAVMKEPTLQATCPPEEFVAHADVYHWLLDHPDRTAAAWRKLGVEAIEIKMLKDGRFVWKDDSSELTWQSVAQGPNGRIWYAEGRVKPTLFLPTYPVKAVAVLVHSEKPRSAGDSIIRHQVELYLRSDSRAASMMTRLLGNGATQMAEDGSQQLLMFFSGIAQYVHRKPEKARELFADTRPNLPSRR